MADSRTSSVPAINNTRASCFWVILVEELSSSLIETIQWLSTRTSCCCKWKSSVHVAVQKPLACPRAKVNWDFNRSDLRTSWQDTLRWNRNSIIQFAPVNTFTAVRSVSCIYLAGITLVPCGFAAQYRNEEKRRCATGPGVTAGSFLTPPYSRAQDLCFIWRPSVQSATRRILASCFQ